MIFVTMLLSIFLASCIPRAGTLSDIGIPIVVKNGNHFTNELASNATTGFRWGITPPVDSEYLKVIKTYYDET